MMTAMKGEVSGPSKWWLLQVVTNATLGSFQFGYNLAVLNTCLKMIVLLMKWCGQDELTAECDAARNRDGAITAGVFVGAAVGCLLGGRWMHRGRRRTLMIAHLLFIVGSLLSAASLDFWSLLLSRIIVGVGVGVATVAVPMYISEVTPADKRGAYGVMNQLLITVGIMVAIALGNVQRNDPQDWPSPDTIPTREALWWRFMLGFSAVPSIISLTIFLFVFPFETPHFLVEEGKADQALPILEKMYCTSGEADAEAQTAQAKLDDIQRNVEERRASEKKTVGLFDAFRDPWYRYALLVGWVLSAFQQLSGINAFIAASNHIFEQAGFTGGRATLLSTCMGVMNVILTLVTVKAIDWAGRRKLLVIGTIGQFVATAPTAVLLLIGSGAVSAGVMIWLPVASVFGYVVFFAIAYGPVLWVYLNEIYPVEIKGPAVGSASALNWVACIAVVFLTKVLNNTLIFSIFSCCSLFACVFVFLFVLETSGVSIDESPYLKGRPSDSTAASKAKIDSLSGKQAIAEIPRAAEVDGIPARPAGDMGVAHTDAASSLEGDLTEISMDSSVGVPSGDR
ncbi:unnamed protein product [Vitrella brassicaformis CCMP3155]|uniref:Hexose transporter 1 n=2 Tax=Vitrella brassicaformis TaxID=1169539 RepID=A0A0G4GZD8_VITBC|nr:unnamed protein product [Vitrella brassicaformis CCMP3155]|mmetsp:Transcript_40071/g.114178  ORF Transcript_40071/g.114178 Transcript_40071/m.114178 type:complete len:567 (-) Transcript_40071:524-2224(-)|eukprot:CEM36622.1 unnamed protein product [Vitrella brassicaformis CCMP3155]